MSTGGGGGGGGQLQLPEIDFRGLDPSNPGGHVWDAVRDQVMRALDTHGCFQAIYDQVSPELKDELFRKAAPELFALPLETKMQSGGPADDSRPPFQGYIGQLPNMAYESMRVDYVSRFESVDEFARLMWPPDGNPAFRDAVWTFGKQVMVLEQTVHRMILQGLGVEKYYDSHIESMAYAVRMAEYGVSEVQENNIPLRSHVDLNMITIVCQHLVDGLEVQTKDGNWIHVPATQNAFNVMLGESFRAWSNGRLWPAVHRVRMPDDRSQLQLKRYSMILSCRPRDDCKVEAQKELVDEAHPPHFKPYNYLDYLRFRFSAEAAAEKDPIMAFCGVEA